MSEMVVAIILVSFVVAGGLFIFWPDLLSLFTKKSSGKKAKKSKKTHSVQEAFDEFYSAEDELIDADAIMKGTGRYYGSSRYGSEFRDFQTARAAVRSRNERAKLILTDLGKNGYNCPVCNGSIMQHYDQIDIGCTCPNQFRSKLSKMAEKLGIQTW